MKLKSIANYKSILTKRYFCKWIERLITTYRDKRSLNASSLPSNTDRINQSITRNDLSLKSDISDLKP